jgi:hypothetical protein
VRLGENPVLIKIERNRMVLHSEAKSHPFGAILGETLSQQKIKIKL